jgi:broad specificity phosphatase PhoE
MSILLIRHGETDGNANRVVQVPETPLSERGRSQAALLGGRLANAGISRILASDYSRAAMTAASLSDAAGIGVDSEPLLRERNFGDHRGCRYDDLDVELFSPDYAPPGGEDWETFHARVDLAWGAIRLAAGQTAGDLAVVTHGLVLYSLILRHVMLADDEEASMGFANTSLTVVEAREPWRVGLFNCSAHLDASTGNNRKSISGI